MKIKVYDIFFSMNRDTIEHYKGKDISQLIQDYSNVIPTRGVTKNGDFIGQVSLGLTDDRFPGYIYNIGNNFIYLGYYEKVN